MIIGYVNEEYYGKVIAFARENYSCDNTFHFDIGINGLAIADDSGEKWWGLFCYKHHWSKLMMEMLLEHEIC